MINFDFWYNNTLKDVCFVSVSFSDADVIYRGNLYDKNKKIIGDFSCRNSCEIERTFPGIFGN